MTFEVKGEVPRLEAEALFVATGLRANTEGLGLEEARVETEGGFVKVNAHLQTSVPHIYAAGDVAGILPLETVAARQGRLAVEHMFGLSPDPLNYRLVPRAVYTDPELASVGYTEEELRAERGRCACRTLELRFLERAALEGRTEGLINLVVDPENGRLAGVHMVGPRASEVINAAVYALRAGFTLRDLRESVQLFPTMGEALKKAAQSFTEDPARQPCCVE